MSWMRFAFISSPGVTPRAGILFVTPRGAWEYSKETVAQILEADPSEVIFTSGGTEANNLAIFGLAGAESAPGHIVATAIEHPAIAEPLARLEAASFTINRVPVDNQGVADVSQMTRLFRDNTRFATLMLANNETGAIQPVCNLRPLATSTVSWYTPTLYRPSGGFRSSFQDLGVATLAASAHKFHGPPGIGLLLVRRGIRLGSRLFGGGQQQGRRPGTVPVPLVVGLATALQKWQSQSQARASLDYLARPS